MPDIADGIPSRLRQLIVAAGSQKELARLGGISDGTLINWLRDLGIRETKLQEFSGKLGVSIEWLRDGEGEAEEEIAKVAEVSHGSTARAASGGVRESPPDMECPLAQTLPPRGMEKYMLMAAEGMEPIALVDMLGRVLRDGSVPVPERNAVALRLTTILSRKLAAQGGIHRGKN